MFEVLWESSWTFSHCSNITNCLSIEGKPQLVICKPSREHYSQVLSCWVITIKHYKIIAVWNVQEGALQDKLYGCQRAQGSSLQLASVTCVSLWYVESGPVLAQCQAWWKLIWLMYSVSVSIQTVGVCGAMPHYLPTQKILDVLLGSIWA